MAKNDLLILTGEEVVTALTGREDEVIEAVRLAYEAHAKGESSLPHSSFLRFPDNDKDRIISLPAYIGEGFGVAGLKWIASVPGNIERGLERASAVVILNDRATGRPQAILEGSLISKQRTAASAALAAKVLRRGRLPEVVGFVGCGPINLEVGRFLAAVWPELDNFLAFDLDPARAAAFGENLLSRQAGGKFEVVGELDELLARSSVVSFGTTATVPYVSDLSACQPGTTILHVSLRDLSPEVILAHDNIVDDMDHVCRAQTSIFLASEVRGDRDFVHGSLGDILLGRVEPPTETDGRLSIFSPFGLGVLDLAVAQRIYETAKTRGDGTVIESFLP